MRGYNRSQERDYDRTRLLLFEMINGNPNVKKSSKPKRVTDIFRLSIDPVIVITATKVTKQQADTVEKLGYKVPEIFIGNGEYNK